MKHYKQVPAVDTGAKNRPLILELIVKFIILLTVRLHMNSDVEKKEKKFLL